MCPEEKIDRESKRLERIEVGSTSEMVIRVRLVWFYSVFSSADSP
jgi:hypothetical protein